MAKLTHAYAKVTVDVVLFTIDGDILKALFIKRTNEPFLGSWAFPGGFIREEETGERAASRILLEKAGVKDMYIEQLYTFTDLRRDPRGRIVSIAYFGLVPRDKIVFVGSDLQNPTLFPVGKSLDLAFDHDAILRYAHERLRAKLEYTNIVFSLLRPKFTLSELQKAYEVILGKKLDKRNFRKKYLSLDLIKATPQYERGGKRRPARLYVFKAHDLAQLKKFF